MNQIDIEGIRSKTDAYFQQEQPVFECAECDADHLLRFDIPALLDAYTEQAAEIARLEGLVERTAAERDEAIEILAEQTICIACKHDDYCEASCGVGGSCYDRYSWQWHGFSEREV